jgi:hypothetical protein
VAAVSRAAGEKRPPKNAPAPVRAQVAREAGEVLAGRRRFWDFVEGLPAGAEDDELIWELLDIIEHEPKVGGILGVSAEEHARHMARAHRVIALLGRPAVVAWAKIPPTDEAIECGNFCCRYGVLTAAKETISGRLFSVCSDCGLQWYPDPAGVFRLATANVADFVDATAHDIENAGWGKYLEAYARQRRQDRRNFLLKVALWLLAGSLYLGGLAYLQRSP